MKPIEGTQGIVTFYGYSAPGNNASAKTGYEVANNAVLFAYRDPQGNISLVFILDKIQDGSGGKYNIAYEGAQGMEMLVYDDNLGGNDAWNVDLQAGTGSVQFTWGPCCTDGFAMGYLEGDFCIDFTPTYSNGLMNLLVWEDSQTTKSFDDFAPFSICSGQ